MKWLHDTELQAIYLYSQVPTYVLVLVEIEVIQTGLNQGEHGLSKVLYLLLSSNPTYLGNAAKPVAMGIFKMDFQFLMKWLVFRTILNLQ